MNAAEFAKYFDHTALKATVKSSDIEVLCQAAIEHGFYSVCVNSYFLPLAVKLCRGTGVLPIAVVGFPLGVMATDAKVDETKYVIGCGAQEIDMVVNLGAYFSGLEQVVRDDIARVVEASGPMPVKVILETAYLTNEQIFELSQWAAEMGAKFVKTSTGFATRGASVADIKIMRQALKQIDVLDKVEIKASGGMQNLNDVLAMIEAGATRIGASASVAIMNEFKARQKM